MRGGFGFPSFPLSPRTPHSPCYLFHALTRIGCKDYTLKQGQEILGKNYSC
jgi:hypothetical protein